MIIYDLFSGTGSSTQAFKDAGHTVISFEIDGNFVATQHVNILNLKAADLIAKYGRPDFIWASPPCTAFSVASMTKHWEKKDKLAYPKTDGALKGMALVEHTLNLIKELDPKLQNIFDGATAQTLRDLGEVSRKVMAQPKGSFANNSNTFVAALADKLGKGAEQALNLAIPGASIGTAAAQVRARRAGRKFEEQSLKPLAGVEGKSNLIRDILSKKE